MGQRTSLNAFMEFQLGLLEQSGLMAANLIIGPRAPVDEPSRASKQHSAE
jgi:hypothetical protein